MGSVTSDTSLSSGPSPATGNIVKLVVTIDGVGVARLADPPYCRFRRGRDSSNSAGVRIEMDREENTTPHGEPPWLSQENVVT